MRRDCIIIIYYYSGVYTGWYPNYICREREQIRSCGRRRRGFPITRARWQRLYFRYYILLAELPPRLRPWFKSLNWSVVCVSKCYIFYVTASDPYTTRFLTNFKPPFYPPMRGWIFNNPFSSDAVCWISARSVQWYELCVDRSVSRSRFSYIYILFNPFYPF